MNSVQVLLGIQALLHYIRVSEAAKQFSRNIDSRTNLKEVVRKFGIQNELITIADLKTLDPNISWQEEELLREDNSVFEIGWLVDQIMDYYLHLICRHPSNGILCIQSFLAGLLPANYLDDAVIENFRPFASERYQKMIIPCNPTANHWILFVASKYSTSLYILDPLNENPLIMNPIRRAVENLEQILLAVTGQKYKHTLPRRLMQSDGHSCGVFVCYYAYRFMYGGKLTEPFDELRLRRKIHDSILSLVCLLTRSTPDAVIETRRDLSFEKSISSGYRVRIYEVKLQ